MPENTFVAVKVVGAHQSVMSSRVRECGDLFRYETFLDSANGVALRVACLCPGGHGPTRLPWRGWFEAFMGRYDLIDAPEAVLGARYAQYSQDTDPTPTEAEIATEALAA